MKTDDLLNALKQCIANVECRGCPLGSEAMCRQKLLAYALETINRQKSKIERLKRYDEARDIRLHARLTETARAEAIREFAGRYKAEIKKEYEGIPYHDLYVDAINRLVREMTGYEDVEE